jgi:hypothetical protein
MSEENTTPEAVEETTAPEAAVLTLSKNSTWAGKASL